MARSPTWQYDTIVSVLEVCSRVKNTEEKLFDLYRNNVTEAGSEKEQFNHHVKYNGYLEKLLQLLKADLGRAVLPSMIPKTIEDGGPSFLNLDPKKMAFSFNWSSEHLNNFKKLRNETISLWKTLEESMSYATVEESNSVSSNDNISE